MRGSRSMLMSAAALLATASARAQTGRPRGAIDAAVTDSALMPLANATATLLGTTVTVTTGSGGRFRIVDLPPRDYIIIVRRIGYAPVSAVVRIPSGDTLRMSYMLAPAATTLDTVVVSERSMPARLAEFEERRRHTHGQFMTQNEIEALNPVGMVDVFRSFRYLSISGEHVESLRARCPMTFFVDGVRIPSPDVERDLPSPKDIAGIEVYINSADIPLQYKSFGTDVGLAASRSAGFCGVVLLWTRAG